MIFVDAEFLGNFVAFWAWTIGCWVAGVAWALYRALGWVDRIKRWADTVPLEQEEGVNQC